MSRTLSDIIPQYQPAPDIKYIQWGYFNTSQTALSFYGYALDTSAQPLTLTLPATPTEGDVVGVKDAYSYSFMNNITIDANGNNIEGDPSNVVITTNGSSVILVYINAHRGWVQVNEVTGSNADNFGLIWEFINTDATATPGRGYAVDASLQQVTLSLPLTPSPGALIGIKYLNKSGSYLLVIDRNTNKIETQEKNLTLDSLGSAIVLCFISTAIGWVQVSEALSGEGPQGAQGEGFEPDAYGLLSALGTYDAEAEGFAYLATDTGDLYVRVGASGNWEGPYPIIKPVDMNYENKVSNFNAERFKTYLVTPGSGLTVVGTLPNADRGYVGFRLEDDSGGRLLDINPNADSVETGAVGDNVRIETAKLMVHFNWDATNSVWRVSV